MSWYVGEVEVLVADELNLGDRDQTKVLLAHKRRVLNRLLADVMHVLRGTKQSPSGRL